jgi:orotidine-5'-phosphate decarboxylase
MLARDKKVFADLKFYDIPATVGSAVRQLKDRGASFVTVHGDKSIMEAAAENKGDNLKVLVVTVLTSLDRSDLGDLGIDCDVGELVLSRAKLAFETGCDGVISSGVVTGSYPRASRRQDSASTSIRDCWS